MIATERVAGLVQPFQRLAVERVGGRGLGLGLSIADAIVTAHCGRLTLSARPDGGLEVDVLL